MGWLDRSIELGGPAGARSLAKKLEAMPAEFEGLRDKTVTLLEDESLDGCASRTALAETLPLRGGAPQIRAVARTAVRAMVRDGAVYGGRVREGLVKQLIEFTGDGALRADLPAAPTKLDHSLAQRAEPFAITIDRADAGTHSVADAAFLHNGRTLVALGEAGAAMLTRDGRTIAQFDVPAHKLVVSDNGARAIALGRRGNSGGFRGSTCWHRAALNGATPESTRSPRTTMVRSGLSGPTVISTRSTLRRVASTRSGVCRKSEGRCWRWRGHSRPADS